ncbi:uncharacterized protein LOC128722424 [Anopheles nili]|uniref:uncharacterized protein LOC128722424 n=1 Tax=Anopheles nili TaxID=185578 RepID=UPI00237B1A06|nr:uncharacterized protein LOC128722424 [Anopheles nili]
MRDRASMLQGRKLTNHILGFPFLASVLIFPPFSSYRRFLIHKVCAGKSFSQHDVVTFSIGIGNERRTVVCFRHQLLQDVKSTTGKSFEESTCSSSKAVSSEEAPTKAHYVSWRSSTTAPTVSTNTITTSTGIGHATATTSCYISGGPLVCGRKRDEKRVSPNQANMGTESILPCAATTEGNQHHQQQHQQTCLSDGCAGAFADTAKVPPLPYSDGFGQNHQYHFNASQGGVAGKFPPVVGIYRPPAARRALKLADNVVQQLAPPAACEHPNDYGHLTSSEYSSTPDQHHEQVKFSLNSSTLAGTEPEKAAITSSPPDSNEGQPLGKGDSRKDGASEKTGQEKQEPEHSSQPSLSDAARTVGTNVISGSNAGVTSPSTRTNRPHRERRPDRAVYIPRARRSLTTPPVTATATHPPAAATVSEVVPPDSSLKSISRVELNRTRLPEVNPLSEPVAASTRACIEPCDELLVDNFKTKLLIDEVTNALPSVRELHNNTPGTANCDSEIKPSAHSESTEVSLATLTKRSLILEEQQSQCLPDDRDQEHIDKEASCRLTILPQGSPVAEDHHCRDFASETVSALPCVGLTRQNTLENDQPLDAMNRNNQRNRNARNVATPPTSITTNLLISDRSDGEKVDRDEKELRRASQEINRSNRRIMKQTFNSDVLEIDEPTPPQPTVIKSQKEKRAAEDEEEDWESMYDDNGDCLNPKMLEELTTAVGKVSIEMPQSDYKSYQTKQAVLNEEEFPHVLEVSNFPAEFKTQDLMMLFSQYKESGFDIKWVDDTHALAVFSSSKIAAEVLATGLSFVRVKPLAEATTESRSKARKCASSLQPYRARPETCAALARRLVTSALGVRLKTAPEERENERRVLREAKERKLLAAKQRDEVWDS